MPVDRSRTDDSEHSGGLSPLLSALSVAFLVGIWLWLVLSSGGYPAANWIFPVLTLGVFGLTVASMLAIPRRPRRLSLTVLALSGAYSLWVAASNLWAGSSPQAWLGSTRTFAYLLVLGLALTYFTSQYARTAFRYLVMLAALILLALLLWRMWSAPDLAALFSGKRLAYPAGRADSAAALFLVSFWPLMWLAAGPDERAPVRGIALGLATGLLGLAIMTQSRSAAWSIAVTLVLLFALSPGRFRLLFYLVVPGLFMVYAFPRLNQYWTLGPEALAGDTAARTLTVAVVAAGFIGMILALLEGWIKVSGRMRVIFGTVVLAACIGALVYGAVGHAQEIGSPLTWFRDAWGQLITEPAAGEQTSPTGVSSIDNAPPSSRADIWRLTWQQLEKTPLLGAGADNSALGLGRQGSDIDVEADRRTQQPNSLVLQILGDTGIIGAVLAFGAILVSIAGMLWPRLAVGWRRAKRAWRVEDEQGSRRGQRVSTHGTPSRWGDEPMAYGWQMALFAGAAYWFLQSNLESLWQMTGVTMPALLMIAAGVAATDARAGILWPWLDKWSRRKLPVPAMRQDPTSDRPGGVGPDPVEPREKSARRLPRGVLRPAGPLSQAFRIALIILSLTVVVFSGSALLVLLL